MTTPGYLDNPYHPQAATGPLKTHPMRVGEIFRGAVDVYKRNAKTILILAALAALASLIFQVVGTSIDVANHYYDSPRPHGASNGGSGFMSVLSTLVGTWFTAAQLFAFAQGALNRNAEVATSLKAGARRIGWLLLTNILMGLAVFAAIIPGGIVLGIGAAMGGGAGWIIGTIGAIIILTCVFCVGMRFMLAPTITVMEEVSSVTAMSRSWRLTRGRFLQLFGVMVIFGILFGILMGLSYGVALAAGSLMSSRVTGVLVAGILAAIPAIFLSPLTHFIPAVCYVDQRIREENFAPVLENAYAESNGHGVTPQGPSETQRIRFDN